MCLVLPLVACAVLQGGRRGPARQAEAPKHEALKKEAPQQAAPKKAAPVHASPKASASLKANVSASASANATRAAPKVVGKPQRHVMRICNAFPGKALSVMASFGGMQQKLTPSKIPMKGCEQFVSTVTVGDYLEFYVDGVKKSVTLPAVPMGNDVVALFVVYEKVPGSATVWYHYFEKLKNSQVAVIDVAPPTAALKGESSSKLLCLSGACHAGKKEDISTDSVEPVFPGHYEISIAGEHTVVAMDLYAGESYAVMRMGPDDLVTFPSASAPPQSFAAQRGGAAAAGCLGALLLVLAQLA